MVMLLRGVHYAGMKHKESKGPTRRRDPSDHADEGRANRSSRHPIGQGPEAGHVVQDDFRNAGGRPERKAEAPAAEENLAWSRDPSNPAGSTGQTKPARMYADDEQEQAAALARQGVEAAQRELARGARRTEPGKATGKQ
jgi:hypothetical protein